MAYKRFICSWCGERKNPNRPDCDYQARDPNDGTPMCEDCFTEQYEEPCVICEEYMLKEDRGFAYFAEEVDGGYRMPAMRPGFYRILDFPIVCGPMLGAGWIESKNLRFLGPPLPPSRYRPEENGHCCFACVQRAGLLRPYSLPVFDPDGSMKRPALDTPKWYDLPAQDLPAIRRMAEDAAC